MKTIAILSTLLFVAPLIAIEPETIIVAPLCAPTAAWNQSGKLNEMVKGFCGCDPLAWGQVVTYHALTTNDPPADWQPTPVTDFVQFPNHRTEMRTTTSEDYNWENVRDQKGDDAARLMWDLGILGHTLYTDVGSSGTVGNTRIADYFGYKGKGWTYTLPFYWKDNTTRQVEETWPDIAERLVRCSLHAKAPMVMIVIPKNGGIHAIVCDGYGYAKDGTLLLHFHDGWGPTSATWRPFSFLLSEGNPTQQQEGFNVLYANVHPNDLGCIVAGRITRDGNPLPNVTVTLSTGQSTTTDATGSYCFTGLQPETDYTLTATDAACALNIVKPFKTGRFIDDALRNKAQDESKDKHIFLETGNILLDFPLTNHSTKHPNN
ncbi:MAG: C10 family peptidase [bacterium]|nr:C10 family peptidase [bacterium]